MHSVIYCGRNRLLVPSMDIRWILRAPCRSLSFFSSNNATTTTTPWQRQALQVKDIDIKNPYLEAIREKHDPSMQLKTLEDELKGTIGKALGKQGEKVLCAIHRMHHHYELYQQQDESNNSNKTKKLQHAKNYNSARQDAIQARWELIVHRQAVGMIVQNHSFVLEKYPIANAIVITDDDHPHNAAGTTTVTAKGYCDEHNNQEDHDIKKPKNKFGDQLDWWQKVGRWR